MPTEWKAKADLYEDILEMVRGSNSKRRNRRNESGIKCISAFYTKHHLPNLNIDLQQMKAGIA
ncbi:MAG TPA: hypothetical protein VGE44_00110 [Daejeonella sp.]|uniref:hypothetical protein n=1 Tax=Daejeonella sp. TaxID=2805397 RepID=UPI002ED7EB5C